MKKKALFANISLVILVIALIAAAIFLLNDRTSAKAFSDIFPNGGQFDSCQIICVDGEKLLTDDELDDLMAQLKQLQYYKRGSYGDVMEGNVYHAFFSSQKAESVEVHISDTGKVYVGANYYEFAPEVDLQILSSYLESCLNGG